MKNQPAEIIANYEILFAVRTGITVLMPKNPVFDCDASQTVSFRPHPENPDDLLIDAAGKSAVLKGLKKDYMEESVERGFIMPYEMQGDEVVRCTPCRYRQ